MHNTGLSRGSKAYAPNGRKTNFLTQPAESQYSNPGIALIVSSALPSSRLFTGALGADGEEGAEKALAVGNRQWEQVVRAVTASTRGPAKDIPSHVVGEDASLSLIPLIALVSLD